MSRYLLKNALILTGDSLAEGSLGIDGERIAGIWHDEGSFPGAEEIDLDGRILMAGGIDAHVHFRDPGLTWKADIGSESYAALLGGITTFIDMPNTLPPTTTQMLWKPNWRKLRKIPRPIMVFISALPTPTPSGSRS